MSVIIPFPPFSPAILDEGHVVDHGGGGQGRAHGESAGDPDAALVAEVRAQLHAGVDSDGEEGVDEGEPPGALALRRDVADVGVDAEEEAHQPPGAVLQRLRRNGEELLILIDRDLGGHTHVTSTKISEFWTVCIYRIKFLQSQLLRLIFWGTPSPEHCGRHV